MSLLIGDDITNDVAYVVDDDLRFLCWYFLAAVCLFFLLFTFFFFLIFSISLYVRFAIIKSGLLFFFFGLSVYFWSKTCLNR